MSVPYKNPISSVQVSTPQSVSRTSVFGTNFSTLSVGGYMEVYNLSDLYLTLTASSYPSLIQLSANTIPIRYTKGNNTFLSPDYLTLNSDNISSGRRRIGMLVYVHETDKVYQYVIPNYDTLWNNLSGLTGFSSVTYSDYTTVVNSRSSAGQSFIQSWTASTIEGVGGYISTNANWRIFQTNSSSGGLSYFISASTPTETIMSGDRWFNTDTGVELVWIDDGDSQQWIQPFSVPGPLSPDAGYYTTTGITTGQTLTWDKTYWGISGNSNIDLVLPSVVGKEGYYLIIKDESGICGIYRIRITPSSGTIDNNNYVDMNINYMSLTCMVRGGNWYLI